MKSFLGEETKERSIEERLSIVIVQSPGRNTSETCTEIEVEGEAGGEDSMAAFSLRECHTLRRSDEVQQPRPENGLRCLGSLGSHKCIP
jgi:hypothetical protein